MPEKDLLSRVFIEPQPDVPERTIKEPLKTAVEIALEKAARAESEARLAAARPEQIVDEWPEEEAVVFRRSRDNIYVLERVPASQLHGLVSKDTADHD
jgi:hypothetical protein